MASCTHLDQLGVNTPPDAEGCVDCLATGGRWVHLRRCLACGHRQRRQGLVAQRLCIADAVVIQRPDFDAGQAVERGAQLLGAGIQLFRRQQRALDIVAALLVAVLRLRPEGGRSIEHVRRQHR